MNQITEQQFWDVMAERAGALDLLTQDIARVFRHFPYPLDGHGKRHLESVRNEINRVLAEDDERERGRNAA